MRMRPLDPDAIVVAVGTGRWRSQLLWMRGASMYVTCPCPSAMV
jgi:hypothetical protein